MNGKVDRTVPVSREDYDAMADQRDRFRAALIEAAIYLSGAKTYAEDARAEFASESDEDTRFEIEASLDAAVQNAQHGLALIRKALKLSA